jgi:hypothetical protein
MDKNYLFHGIVLNLGLKYFFARTYERESAELGFINCAANGGEAGHKVLFSKSFVGES